MKVLYNTLAQNVLSYPRSDNEPVIGLSPEYLVLEKIESDPPSPTAIPSWEVDLAVLEYRQIWVEPEPPLAESDWLAFNMAMIPFNTESTFEGWLGQFKEAYRVALTAASSEGNTGRVQSLYNLLKLLNLPTTEQINEWQSIANTHFVPLQF